MVAGRAIQGAGGGALLPVTMALVGDILPPGRRAAALGLVGAIDTLGWVMGPLWGALLVGIAPGQEPWRWVFIVNIPLAIVAALAIGRAGVTRQPPGSDWLRRLDIPGALLLAGIAARPQSRPFGRRRAGRAGRRRARARRFAQPARRARPAAAGGRRRSRRALRPAGASRAGGRSCR